MLCGGAGLGLELLKELEVGVRAEGLFLTLHFGGVKLLGEHRLILSLWH